LGIQERKEREKGQRKEDILDAAQKVFFDKGLQATTMEEIAEQAELSKGTLYLYYNSKEDLYLSVMMRGMQILNQMFESCVAKGSNTAGTVIGLMETFFEFSQKQPKYFRMSNFFQNPEFHKQISDQVRVEVQSLNEKIWSLVIGVLQRGIIEGALMPDLNATETAVILWSNASSLLMRIDTESEIWKSMRQIDLLRVLATSNALLLDSILTPKAKIENRSLLATIHPRFAAT
jgi:AcrR family transcriptional regulator